MQIDPLLWFSNFPGGAILNDCDVHGYPIVSKQSSLIVNIMFNILKLNSCFSGGSL